MDYGTDCSKLTPPHIANREACIMATSKVLPDVKTDEDDNSTNSTLPKASKASKPAKQTAAKPVKAKASTTAIIKKTIQTKTDRAA